VRDELARRESASYPPFSRDDRSSLGTVVMKLRFAPPPFLRAGLARAQAGTAVLVLGPAEAAHSQIARPRVAYQIWVALRADRRARLLTAARGRCQVTPAAWTCGWLSTWIAQSVL